jgi:tetratricopeptide (TPR) repeat protein
LEEALRRYKQIGDLWSSAHALNSLGDLFLELGDTVQARVHYEEALRLFRAQKDLWMIAWNLEGLGRVSLEEDNLSEAASYTRDSLELFYQCRDRSNTLILLSRVGTISRKQGNHPRAAFLLGAVDTLSDVGNNRRMDPPEELTSVCTEYQTEYIREWTCGQASTLDQAVAYALHTDEDDEEHPGVGSGNT